MEHHLSIDLDVTNRYDSLIYEIISKLKDVFHYETLEEINLYIQAQIEAEKIRVNSKGGEV